MVETFRDAYGKAWKVRALSAAEGRAYRFRRDPPPKVEGRSPGGSIVRGVDVADLRRRADAMGRFAP